MNKLLLLLAIATIHLTLVLSALRGLNCNVVETFKGNSSIAIPAGVCFKRLNWSYILKCAQDDTMYYHSYSNSSDCTGASQISLASDIYSSANYEEVALTCNQSACRYIEITSYNNLSFAGTDACEQFAASATTRPFPSDIHTISVYVENYCNAYRTPKMNFKWICADSQLPAAIANTQYLWQADCGNYQYHDITTAAFKYDQEQCVYGTYDIHTELEPYVYRAFLVNVTCGIAEPYYGSDTPSPTNVELDSLACNGVETQKDGLTMAVPAGVCVRETQSSWLLTCYNETNMYRHMYPASLDCTGTDFFVTPAEDVYPLSQFDGVNIVCNQVPCSYIRVLALDDNSNYSIAGNWTSCRRVVEDLPENVNLANMHTVSVNVENFNNLMTSGSWQWCKGSDNVITHHISTPHSFITSRGYPFVANQFVCASEDQFVDPPLAFGSGKLTIIYVDYGIATESHYVAPSTTMESHQATTTETTAFATNATFTSTDSPSSTSSVDAAPTQWTVSTSTAADHDHDLSQSNDDVRLSKQVSWIVVCCIVLVVGVVTVMAIRNRKVKQSFQTLKENLSEPEHQA